MSIEKELGVLNSPKILAVTKLEPYGVIMRNAQGEREDLMVYVDDVNNVYGDPLSRDFLGRLTPLDDGLAREFLQTVGRKLPGAPEQEASETPTSSLVDQL